MCWSRCRNFCTLLYWNLRKSLWGIRFCTSLSQSQDKSCSHILSSHFLHRLSSRSSRVRIFRRRTTQIVLSYTYWHSLQWIRKGIQFCTSYSHLPRYTQHSLSYTILVGYHLGSTQRLALYTLLHPCIWHSLTGITSTPYLCCKIHQDSSSRTGSRVTSSLADTSYITQRSCIPRSLQSSHRIGIRSSHSKMMC